MSGQQESRRSREPSKLFRIPKKSLHKRIIYDSLVSLLGGDKEMTKLNEMSNIEQIVALNSSLPALIEQELRENLESLNSTLKRLTALSNAHTGLTTIQANAVFDSLKLIEDARNKVLVALEPFDAKRKAAANVIVPIGKSARG